MPAVTPADYPKFLAIAKEEARKGLEEGGVPIGACVVHLPTSTVLGTGHNRRMQDGTRTSHAEMDALDNVVLPNGEGVPDSMFKECAMFTTLSACPMCSGACVQYGFGKVVMAENTTIVGGEKILHDNGIELVDMKDQECVKMMADWIASPAGQAVWGNPHLNIGRRNRK